MLVRYALEAPSVQERILFGTTPSERRIREEQVRKVVQALLIRLNDNTPIEIFRDAMMDELERL
jgi:hypothetical protein